MGKKWNGKEYDKDGNLIKEIIEGLEKSVTLNICENFEKNEGEYIN